ncbi:hypothetical protein [Haloarcula litorea]|uniref:hypothetical protein n=1 Tax=Haloarcula litorea TaxID=3032579 RepID=UPI0023E89CEF|nr:hypothetical protein [Halomicroarcula sp. GDY20]
MADDLEIPLTGTTLVVGPSNAGKTRQTADAMTRWIDANGPEGCVILDFAPEVERDGTVLGGHVTRFVDVPDGVHHGVVDAHAPRADGDSPGDALALAEANAAAAAARFDAAPDDPRAVFVNDATIACQADAAAADRLLAYCDRAETAVLNAFESDELGVDDPVSENERAALARFREWADRVVDLS